MTTLQDRPTLGGQALPQLPVNRPAGVWRRLRRASPFALIYSAAILIFYTIIFIIPFGTGIWLAFQNWDFITTPKFVGLRNFSKAFTDPYFWQALEKTVLFSVVEIAVGLTLAMLFALALSQILGKWQNFYLSLYYLPVITPLVVSIYLWRWLYRPTGGAINTMLDSVGLPAQPFLASPQQALWAITLVIIWANLGTGIVLFLAGINDVPESLFEAARLDGAGFWQSFLPHHPASYSPRTRLPDGCQCNRHGADVRALLSYTGSGLQHSHAGALHLRVGLPRPQSGLWRGRLADHIHDAVGRDRLPTPPLANPMGTLITDGRNR